MYLWGRGSYELKWRQYRDETVASIRQRKNAGLAEYVLPTGNYGE